MVGDVPLSEKGKGGRILPAIGLPQVPAFSSCHTRAVELQRIDCPPWGVGGRGRRDWEQCILGF